ncbi:MAG: beta family protein [Prosthecobacter sp.]|nr:beta family protein [Prosthecobacter sp.]
MEILYVPIMAAKKGEFDALKNLPSSIVERVLPLLELPVKSDRKTVEESIVSTAVQVGKVWGKRRAFLDISKWSAGARTENGVHVFEFAIAQFARNNVAVSPVVGYDRWGDPVYRQALVNIRTIHSITPCLRLDREAIQDDMLDPDYFQERIADILNVLNLGAENFFVVLDHGDVSNSAVPDLIEATENAIGVLRRLGFGVVIVAGGSMPSSIDKAVGCRDEVGCIHRVEMLAWKAIFSQSADCSIVFGDYTIRSPHAADGVIAPDANAKIRYTIENQYFVVRGHSKKLDSLGAQHQVLARKLIASAHYMQPSFSWADSELFNCSLGAKTIGSATTMISIDGNHHICAIVVEVFEYQQRVFQSARASV